MRHFNTNIILPFIATFISWQIFSITPHAQAEDMIRLPEPGAMVTSSQEFTPVLLKGVKIHPENPLKFDFILDTGHSGLEIESESLSQESVKLIKYFLASLTVPARDLWVNLSPYEKDKIIPEKFGETEMGRDLLAQDYLLKQLTASLINPDERLGEEFWDRVYRKAYQEYGTTEIPINTFNKVWIVPDKAVVYENGDVAFIAESRLKVMLEQDYLALRENLHNAALGTDRLEIREVEKISDVSTTIVREIIIPEIEKEVNEGENFANLRQVYCSMILAAWFKRNLKQTLLADIYVDGNKTRGIDVDDKAIKEKIYQQYLEALKVGVFNYIREDYDPYIDESIPRKYFSGGFEGEVIERILVQEKVSQVRLIDVTKAQTAGQLASVSAGMDIVKRMENLIRILQAFAQSEDINQLEGDETEDDVMIALIEWLKAKNDRPTTWVREAAPDDEGNIVITLSDKFRKSSLGQAVVKYVFDGDGVKAINFKGKDGQWRIVGFEGELAGQIAIEKEEIRLRKQGVHWIVAYNQARRGGPEIDRNEAKKFSAGRDDAIVSASALPKLQGTNNVDIRDTRGRQLKDIKAVALDWDDTIIKSEYNTVDRFWKTLQLKALMRIWYGKEMGDATQEAEGNTFIDRAIGKTDREFFQSAIEKYEGRNLSGRTVDQLVAETQREQRKRIPAMLEEWRKHPDEVFIPGVLEFIRGLHARGIPIYIISANPFLNQFNYPDAVGLTPYIKNIYDSSMTEFVHQDGRKTPLAQYDKAQVVTLLNQEIAGLTGDLLVVGDGTKEALAARDNGIPFMAVAHSSEHVKRFGDLGSQMILSGPAFFTDLEVSKEDATLPAGLRNDEVINTFLRESGDHVDYLQNVFSNKVRTPLLEYRDKLDRLRIEVKDFGEIVTEADHASQRNLLQAIWVRWPDHRVIAEEVLTEEFRKKNEKNKNSPFVWVIDPLDGTNEFRDGSQEYGVPAVLFYKGQPVMGIFIAPGYKDKEGTVITAVIGKGVFVNGARVRLPLVASENNAVAYQELPEHEMSHVLPADRYKALSKGYARVKTKPTSTSLDIARILLGEARVFNHPWVKVWDSVLAAFVEIAGGSAVYLDGSNVYPIAPNVMDHESHRLPQPIIVADTRDRALETAKILAGAPGGIDLNPELLDMETRGIGIDFEIPYDAENLMSIPIDGLTPVIFQITPLDFPLIFGESEESEESLQLSSS